MPNLLSIEDSEALENRYIDKYVIYVEGKEDQVVWSRVVGSNLLDKIEFKVPVEAGSGFKSVFDRVRKERSSNSKIFGLVDGEVIASCGCVDLLIHCNNAMFVREESDFEGIFFISAHELENLLLLDNNTCLFIVNNVTIKEVGTLDANEVREKILMLARRFFIAAIFKYVSSELKFTNDACEILETSRFCSNRSVLQVVKEMKYLIDRQQTVDRNSFMTRVFHILGLVRNKTCRDSKSPEAQFLNIVKLADGKGLMKAIQNAFNLRPTWQGHLVNQFVHSEYAVRFRDELFEALDITT